MINKILLTICILLISSTGWGFPTTGILDLFNDTEGPPMTGWVDLANGWKSNGTNALCNASGQNTSYINSFVYGPDAEAYATIPTLGAGNALQLFLVNASFNGYMVAQNDDNTYDIYRIDAGVASASLKSGSHTWTAGDSVGMFVSSAGVVSIYYKTGAGDWTLLDSYSDGTYINVTTYAVGMTGYDTTLRVDNLGGGTYIPPARRIFITQ